MNVTVENCGQAVILNCSGEFTVDALEGFRQVVDHQLAEEKIRDVVLNLEGVTAVDSDALEYLLDLQEQLNGRLGQVRLANLQDNIAKVLEITRLESALAQFADVAAAIKTM
jgi:stage II sporulation protein AA (anti-sigma F factor antagonist)